jgi:hypothetical protein
MELCRLVIVQPWAERRVEVAKKARKQTSRGRKQDRARVAGRQDYGLRYEAKKSGNSKVAVKTAAKKVGDARKRVERRFGG